MASPDPPRPRRRDATRNRAAILEAATALTAAHGLDIAVQDVAAAAGVAVGTVYRHWPDKRGLLHDVLLQRLDEVATGAETASSLGGFVDSVTELCVRDSSLLELLDTFRSTPGPVTAPDPSTSTPDNRLDAALTVLIDDARDAGHLRNEVTPRDVRVYLIGIRAALGSGDPQSWRRHHAIYRAGLLAGDVPAAPSPMRDRPSA